MSASRTDRGDENQRYAEQEQRIPPFWQKLNSFFLFPFQMEPLIYAVVLSLCSYLLLLGGPFSLLVALALLFAISLYGIKVTALASRGVIDSNDYRPHMFDDDWKMLPLKSFGILMIHGMIVGGLASVSQALGALGSLISSLALPATLMVLVQSCSLRSSLNPFNLLGTIASVGKSYWLLCLFLFLLLEGAPKAAVLLAPIVPEALLMPLLAFVVIYFSWVMAALIGYVMYQNHQDLDIVPLMAPQAAAQEGKPIDPAAAEAARRDAVVANHVQEGNMTEALASAREWHRTGHESVPDQRRYHRLLKIGNDPYELTQHAQRFIPLLMQQQREGEALDVWTSCYKRAPEFRMDSAETTLMLARSAWKSMQATHVMALLQPFEKYYPSHAFTPEALELMVRALKQGLNKPDHALKMFMRMKSRYPEHASTQEMEWVLRDELQVGGETAAR